MYVYIYIYIHTVRACNLEPQNLFFSGPRNEAPNTGAERGQHERKMLYDVRAWKLFCQHLCKVQAT